MKGKMMPKSEKVFELLRLIEENDQLTIEDLAILLDVRPRSIYRYVDTLVKSGFPIYYDKKNGGYKLLTKPAEAFRIEELRIMKSALETFIPICEKDEFRLAKKLIRKIERALPTQRKTVKGEILIASAEAKERYGGTIIIGHSTEPESINPILTTSTISANIIDLVFSRLVRYYSKEMVVPEVAEHWETSDDGLVWTFYLRDDVSFHDGYPLNAHDVAFTYRAICDPRNNSPYASRYSTVYRFETDGDYIFRVVLKHFDVSFIHKMARPITPKYILSDVDINNSSFNNHPIGSGPFKFQDWTDDDTITLVANKDYFEKGRPFLDKVIFKAFKSQREAFEAVRSGEVDITIGLLPDIEFIYPSFEIYSIPKPGYYALFFNLKDPLLSDIRVRQALSFAIDKEAIIEEQLKGHGKIITGPLDVNSWAYNPKVRPTSFDPEKAILLLKEAGFKVIEGEEILDKNGKPLEIELSICASDICYKIAIAIKMQLAKIGIKVRLKYAEEKSCMLFQAALRMIITVGDADVIYSLWHSSAESNIVSYQNPLVDALLDEGRTTLDLQKRKEIYHKIHSLIAEDYPAVFIASLSEIIGSNYRIKWIEQFLQSIYIFDTIKDWQIAKGE
jgi:peptide/nickel transport system substrate-binding protein